MIKRLALFFLIPFFSLYADRFEAVRPVLELYDRGVTILAIGESELIHQIASAYPATCVLASQKKIKFHNANKIIHLNEKLSLESLKDLNKREHFDLILAIHSLHEFENWKEALHELFKLGDNLLIEVSPVNSPEAQSNPAIFGLANYLTNLALTIYLSSDVNHFLWYCFKPKPVHTLLYSQSSTKGISLLTYLKHHGSTPSREWVKEEKKKLPLWKHLSKKHIRIDGKVLY